jgi:transposase
MFRQAAALMIDEAQRRQLESWARAGTTPQRVARKCEVILLASQGISNHSIAQQTGLSRPTVLATRAAFCCGGCDVLRQARKRQRARRVLAAASKMLGHG